jgi:hypothetical protein
MPISPIRPETGEAAPYRRQGRMESGRIYPRTGFIVTNMAHPNENAVAFYNKRGTCKHLIKEDKGAIKWTRLHQNSKLWSKVGWAFQSLYLALTRKAASLTP